MDSNLKIRQRQFEELMNSKTNKKNWEMLCCSKLPLVPFIGAGVSAWCYKTWNSLLKDIVKENYDDEICTDCVEKALSCNKNPNIKTDSQEELPKFHWMEEIAECIFDEDVKAYEKSIKKFSLEEDNSNEPQDRLLRQLRYYVGRASADKKSASVKALYKEFDIERMNENKVIPEYQNYFHKLFKGILITTNFDKALEKCYPSLLSYSYKDLTSSKSKKSDNKRKVEKSWLYRAVDAKIEQMKSELEGENTVPEEGVTVPDIPMLLKVHGSIEQASSIALSRKGYDEAYSGDMPELLRKIFSSTTVIFIGYSLGEDRILDELEKAKQECEKGKVKEFPQHFAFLPSQNAEKDVERAKKLEENYGVYPIFYEKNILPLRMCRDKKEQGRDYHDYCLGLLMENLMRRTMCYPKPLEMLWDRNRYKKQEVEELIGTSRENLIRRQDFSYVRRKEAEQIWNLLNSSKECPLIAITGEHGAGRNTLCQSIIEFQKGKRETLQFFYISLLYCRSWDELCIQLYQVMNIVEPEIPNKNEWRKVAETISERCSGYWRSVLILDKVDNLREVQLWDTLRNMLIYWKEHQTRVIFICREYPKDISCYVWHIGELKNKDAKEVFFNACISGRYREITYLEEKVVNELVSRQDFRASIIEQLGMYANSKGDLTSLLEEWELYYRPGDEGERTVARILWNYLLAEHGYESKNEEEKKNIEKNILWIWGILGNYPGKFPRQFFESYFEINREKFQDKMLSKKTLRYMKNSGLCEEVEEEKQTILLENMVECVKKYFFVSLREDEDIKKLEEEFGQKIPELEETQKDISSMEGNRISCGLRDFRGYIMQPSHAELRKYVQQEVQQENLEASKESMKNIIDILEYLSENVKNNEMRKKNERRKLNLVLHYEIKTIIQFLTHCLFEIKIREDTTIMQRIRKISCNFSHYYHYMPQHAFPLMKKLLEEENKNQNLHEIAGMYQAMGDIERLLGRKVSCLLHYDKAIRLCNQCLLEMMPNPEMYKECIRIKAGTLLNKNYYINSGENTRKLMEAGRDLYIQIGDKWGEAYSNQRIGELEAEELYRMLDKNDSKTEWKGKLERVLKCYNKAADIFGTFGDRTGNAYILKCMGDFIRECKKIWEQKDETYNYYIKEKSNKKCEQLDQEDNETYKYFCIETEGDSGQDSKWLYDAARCYIEAFYCYYEHTNWRGFANVLQAICTCYRTSGKANIESKENLYGLVEECYRWLGDIRGLADTLDYFAHAYEEQGNEQNDVYKYMAISKWAESESIWKKLGNEEKREQCQRKRKKIKEELKESLIEKEQGGGKESES